jgi:Calcineurin-like phosphoesterase
MRILVISDIHYACDAEKARRGSEMRAAGNVVLALMARCWRKFIWLDDPLAHNHRLGMILDAEREPDLVVANGDFSVDSAFVGVGDDAAAESANHVLQRLRGAYGSRLWATLGDHDLGKMSLFGGKGGPRWKSWLRATGEMGLPGVWKLDLGRYTLIGAPSTPLSLPLFEPELLEDERPLWRGLGVKMAAELGAAFSSVAPDQRILFFIHDPSALPHVARIPEVNAAMGRIERTFVGHLHSGFVFQVASMLSGAPRVSWMGQTLRRYTHALREARVWREFKTVLCPSPTGIQMLKDGGYLRLELDPEGGCRLGIKTRRLPW